MKVRPQLPPFAASLIVDGPDLLRLAFPGRGEGAQLGDASVPCPRREGAKSISHYLETMVETILFDIY